MKEINLLYDDDVHDVDILLVPDHIADEIEKVMFEFNAWLCVPENRERFMISDAKGNKVLGIDTKEFVWWLENVKLCKSESVFVLEQHTSFRPEYPTADF